MHESHWPSNLAWLLSLCTCIPNLVEIRQFLEQLEHGNQSVTDGQTDRRTEGQRDRGTEGQRDRGTDEPKLISPVFFKKRVTIINQHSTLLKLTAEIQGSFLKILLRIEKYLFNWIPFLRFGIWSYSLRCNGFVSLGCLIDDQFLFQYLVVSPFWIAVLSLRCQERI